MKKVKRLKPGGASTTASTPSASPAWYGNAGDAPLLIIGSAPGVIVDLQYARELWPHAHLMAVKEACAVAPDILHLVNAHTLRTTALLKYRAEAFPGRPIPFVHVFETRGFELTPGHTHVWSGVSAKAGSVQTAIQIARAMGYGPLLLCGCPMDTPGYFNGTYRLPGVKYDVSRIGFDPTGLHGRRMRQKFELFVKPLRQVWSMSGWTRRILGQPPKLS